MVSRLPAGDMSIDPPPLRFLYHPRPRGRKQVDVPDFIGLRVKSVKLRVLRDPPPLGATHLGLVAALLVKFTSIEFEIGRTLL